MRVLCALTKIFGHLVAAATLVWLAKVGAIWGTDQIPYLRTTTLGMIVVANLIAVTCLLHLIRSASTQRFVDSLLAMAADRFLSATLVRAALVAFSISTAFTALQILPLFPDVYQSLIRAEDSFPWGKLLGIHLAGTLLLGVVRFVPLLLASTRRGLVGPLLGLVLIHGSELAALSLMPPILFLEGFQPPMLPYPSLSTDPSGHEPTIIIRDPNLTVADRNHLFAQGDQAYISFAGSEIKRIREHMAHVHSGKRLFVFYPETTLAFSSIGQLDSFARFVSARLAAEDGEVVVTLGAAVENRNVLYQAWALGSTGEVRGGLIREKRHFVPVLEAGTRRPLATETMFAPTSLWPGSWNAPAICYEALFPSAWIAGATQVVFTNHNLVFNRGLGSRLYDHSLRLLARFFGSPLLLVANQGTSGFFAVSDVSKTEAEEDSVKVLPSTSL